MNDRFNIKDLENTLNMLSKSTESTIDSIDDVKLSEDWAEQENAEETFETLIKNIFEKLKTEGAPPELFNLFKKAFYKSYKMGLKVATDKHNYETAEVEW